MKARNAFARLAALIVCAGATQAGATGTLTCEIDDKAVEFAAQGAVGSIAASISGLSAELNLKAAAGRKATRIALGAESLRQQWLDGPELRLWLRGDGEKDQPAFDLVIVTRKKSELDYAGAYRLTVDNAGKGRKVSGRVKCSLG